MFKRYTRLMAGIAGCVLGMDPLIIHGQSTPPPLLPLRVESPLVTPGALHYEIGLYKAQLDAAYPSTMPKYPRDSIQDAVRGRADTWVRQLQSAPAHGIQQDPMGGLFVAAGHDDAAQQQFITRLKTPGLSVQDHAYTLLMAVQAFGDPTRPDRMMIAEQFQSQLDQLPSEAARWQFVGHQTLAEKYYRLGASAEIVRHSARAYGVVSKIPLAHRGVAFMSNLFLLYGDALSGAPDAKARLDSTAHALMPLLAVPDSLVAQDSMWLPTTAIWRRHFQQYVATATALGTAAPPLSAHYLFNVGPKAILPSLTSATHVAPTRIPLNDGIIRLIEFGELSCYWCQVALPVMSRLQEKFAGRGVEVWYATRTEGAWKEQFVGPAEEATRLAHYYLDLKKLTLPIALWAGEKQPTEDGGLLPEESPSFTAYHVNGTPAFVIVDGSGVVRHATEGYRARADEEQFSRVLEYLIQEAQHRTSANRTVVSPHSSVSADGSPELHGRS